MQRAVLQEWLRRRPFQPFRVRLVSGQTFDIRHPRTNLLGQTFIKIGIPDPENPDPMICDYTEYVPLGQIAQLEPLSAASSAEPPGKE